MKGSTRAGLITIAAWLMAFLVVAAATTVCSSCGTQAAPANRASCPGH